MSKNLLKGLIVILAVMFAYGCTASKNVEVRRYIEVKDRVDQDMDEGNAGFLAGTPQPEDRSEIRKTRKIYVVEVSQETEGEGTEEEVILEESGYGMEGTGFEGAEEIQESDVFDGTVEYDAAEATKMRDVASTNFADTGDADMAASMSLVEYKVEKDDTLQKISKKFYDSYSKWPKIYELNKDVISDPDRIKPGIILQIPVE